MKQQEISGARSSDHSASIWIILAGLLVLSALLALGTLTIINANQQSSAPAGAQPAPVR